MTRELFGVKKRKGGETPLQYSYYYYFMQGGQVEWKIMSRDVFVDISF